MLTTNAALNDLSDRVAIITGAGSGIGRGMALRLASAGATILAADVHTPNAEETCGLVEAAGGIALPCTADVGDEASVQAMVKLAINQWSRVDILCNNAGIMDRMEPAAAVSTTLWDRVLRINVTGPMLGSREVLPHMVQAGRGVIINTISEAGLRGGAAGTAYTVAKHGVTGLTRNIAWAYGKQGIRCNGICPGGVFTNVTGPNGLEGLDAAGREIFGPVLGLGRRVAQPDDMATVALFLASDASSFVNGAIIPVDDGWSAG